MSNNPHHDINPSKSPKISNDISEAPEINPKISNDISEAPEINPKISIDISEAPEINPKISIDISGAPEKSSKVSAVSASGVPKGRLLVFSGPSGVGKGAVVNELLRLMPDIKLSVSATTRPPRLGEKNGVSYYFVSKEHFEEMIARGKFLEYDRHFDNYYGTPCAYVYNMLEEGRDVLLEIDFAGAFEVKKKYPEAKLFFIAPPSLAELEQRLTQRSTETPEQIRFRLRRVQEEMAYETRYDYVVVNDTIRGAVQKIIGIIKENK